MLVAAALAASATSASAAPPTAPPGSTQTTTTVSSTATQAVPGFGQGSLISTVTVSGAGPCISDVQAFTKLFHSYPKDLKVQLTSPQGTSVLLTQDQGGLAGPDDVFSATRWSDAAGVPVARTTFEDKVAKPALSPLQAFGRFLGENPNGQWQLSVTDEGDGDDDGVLKGWSLDIATLAEAPTLVTHRSSVTGVAKTLSATPVTSTINVSGIPTGSVWKADVLTRIQSNARGAMNIMLTSPSGRTVQLVDDNQHGTGAVNPYDNTTFDDAANVLVATSSATAFQSTSVAPVEPLGAFRGENPNGDWTLTVTYARSPEQGTNKLNAWTLEIETAATIGAPKAPRLCTPSTSTWTGTSSGNGQAIRNGTFNASTNGWTSLDLDVNSNSTVGTYLHDVQVVTRIRGGFVDHMRLQLVAPGGQTVWLTRDSGPASSPNSTAYDGALFTDAATKLGAPASIWDGEKPYPSSGPVTPVAPIQPLSRLVGINPRGVWKLRAFDSTGFVTSQAVLKSFSLKLTTFNETPVRKKAAVDSGPITSGAGHVSQSLTISGADTVLDAVDLNIDSPELPGRSFIFLTSPSGTQITIHNFDKSANWNGTNPDGGSDLFSNLTFTDSASESIMGGFPDDSGPATSIAENSGGPPKFSPLEPLGAFRGENPNGVWKVDITTLDSSNYNVDDITLTTRSGACADATPPTNPTLTSSTHTVGARSTSTQVTVGLAGAADPDSGVAGYAYAFTKGSPGSPNATVNLAASATSVTSEVLEDGDWYVNVRTVDGKGNWSEATHLGPFTIDTEVPTTTILSGPADNGVTGNTRPTFTFTSSRGDATYECAMDLPAVYGPCTGANSYQPALALANGSTHTFLVRAKDPYGLGLVDATPQSRTFTVDTSLPVTTIQTAPPATTSSLDPKWTFTSSKAGSTFTCQIDATTPVPCNSGTFAPGPLSNGVRTFRVFATDSGGTVGPTVTSTITVDTIAPTLTVGGTADAAKTKTSPSYPLSAGETVTFQCKVDAAPYATCTSPFAPGALSQGTTHTILFKATDAAGNESSVVTRTVEYDTVAPTASFAAGGPAAVVNTAQVDVPLGSTEPGSTFTCAIDVGTFQPCSSPWKPTLTEGDHTLSVIATDAATNASAPVTRQIKVDVTPPVASFGASSPADGAMVGVSPTFALVSTESPAAFECALDQGAYATCTTPKALGPLAGGPHTLDVKARDAAGNLSTAAVRRTFTVDATAPVVTFAGAPVPNNATRRATATFSSDDPAATYECAVDASPDFATCNAPEWTTSTLQDGTHTVKVRATDVYGNLGAVATSASFTIDTSVPTTTLADSGPTGTVSSKTASFAFTSNEAGATFECKVDTEADFTACITPRTLSGLAEGPHTFSVRARDAAGNIDASPAVRTWTVDTVAPDTTFDSGPANTGASATFTFSSEAGATFACSLDGTAYSPCTSPKTYSSLTSGPHSLTVKATDGAGNTGPVATRSFTSDLIKPVATITGGPAADQPTNVDRPVFTFTSSKPGSTFVCAFDSDPFTPCVSGVETAKQLPGVRTFWVRAIDQYGNASAALAQRTFSIDLTPPATSVITAPPAVSTTGGVSGVVSANEDGTFECNVDGGAWVACDATWVSPTMANGVHRVGIRAVDVAGNHDATPAYFDVTVAIPAPPPVTTSTTTTPTVTTPTTTTPTPPVDLSAVSLVSPGGKKPSLKLTGTPLTLTRTAVRYVLHCPAGVTKCRGAVKLTALGVAKTRGATFASYKGTLKGDVLTVLEATTSAKTRRALKPLKSVKLRMTVTMSSLKGRSVTKHWDLVVPIKG